MNGHQSGRDYDAVVERCKRVEAQLEKTKKQLKQYEDIKGESVIHQVKALDAIKNELLQATRPSIERLESQLSQLSIQQAETRYETKVVIAKSQELEAMHARILQEMTTEFEVIKKICEEHTLRTSNNEYLVPSAMLKTANNETTMSASQEQTIAADSHGKLSATKTSGNNDTSFTVLPINLPSSESTPRKAQDTPPYKPLLGDDYVMYESPLILGIDWNAPTPSPIDSPKATTSLDSNTTRLHNLSQQAITLTPFSIAQPSSPTKEMNELTSIEKSKNQRSLIPHEDPVTPRYNFSDEEVEDWRETLADIHREAFDRSYEFAWEKYIFDFSPDDVYKAILHLVKLNAVVIYNNYTVSTIQSFLVPYILDAVNAFAAAQSNPNALNEIISNYQTNSAEDRNEEDYVSIEIEEFLPKVYDLLLARMLFKQTSFSVPSLSRRDQLNDQLCNSLFDLYLIYDGGKPRPEAKINNSFEHQAVFTSTIVSTFASKLARLSVPHDVYMSVLVFLCYVD